MGDCRLLFAVSTQAGIFAVPAGTVTQLVTYPRNDHPYVVNQVPGVPGPDNAKSASEYRARGREASLAYSTGLFSYLRTLLANVPGVNVA